MSKIKSKKAVQFIIDAGLAFVLIVTGLWPFALLALLIVYLIKK